MSDHTTQQSSIKLCECGCGRPAPIAKRTNTKLGHIKGRPVRFIAGHHSKVIGVRPAEDRFWEKVDKRGPDECWEWQGCRDRRNYGDMYYQGGSYSAHRFSYELHNGSIPPGIDICHTCDNPPCVNPAHLFAGTAKDNHVDMVAKGRNSPPPIRHVPGEKSPLAKFTNAQVRELREQFAQANMSMNAFARSHHVASETMRRIIQRITYPDA